jgi:tRNA pseudouridine13 synthase
VEEEGGRERVIRVWHRRGSRDRRNSQWPGGKNKYCRFTLYKENRDAVDVVNYLARQLGVKSSVFQSAGLKDRRAITTQYYTAFKVKAESLLALNRSLANVKIGNPVYVGEPLKLGQLTGNHFTIILRSVSCDDHVIQEKMTSLRDNGFINYFGMQRFGTSTVPTYHIGRCILHSDWKGAVDAILAPRPGEPEDLTSARQYFMSTRDAEGTLEKFPRGRPLEWAVLKGLVQRQGPNDFLGALKRVPYSSRLMYVHSFQSLVWNRVATHRIRLHGLRPIPGDLVPGNGNGPLTVTEETLSQYTIHDVLLPLPGHDVTLPANDVKNVYESILSEDNLTFQHLNHKVRDFSLHGSYRNIVVRPKDVEWDVVRYDDVTTPLALTDCDELENKPPPRAVEGWTGLESLHELCLSPAPFSLSLSSYDTHTHLCHYTSFPTTLSLLSLLNPHTHTHTLTHS